MYSSLRNAVRAIFGAAGSLLPQWLTRSTRDDLLTASGLANRIVWSIPEDALSEGWTVEEAGSDESDRFEDLETTLELEDRALQAGGSARADGGAWWWVVTAGTDSFEEPLPEGPQEILAVHVVTREEGTPLEWVLDLESPQYARPEIVSVTLIRDGLASQTERVHHSRLIWIPGPSTLVDQTTPRQGYGVSALQQYYPAIRDMERAWSSGATLIERLSMPQLRIEDMAEKAKDKTGWMARMRALVEAMSTKGLMVMFGKDTIEWRGPSIAGYSDLIRSLAERLSSVEGIPLTRLIGQAPAGLSTDDTAGARAYRDLIERWRRRTLRRAILKVHEIHFGEGKRSIVWPSPDKPTRSEMAQISLANAQRDAVLIQSGGIADAESRARFSGGMEKDSPVLDEAYDIEPGEETDEFVPPMLSPGAVVVPNTPPVGEDGETAEEEG